MPRAERVWVAATIFVYIVFLSRAEGSAEAEQLAEAIAGRLRRPVVEAGLAHSTVPSHPTKVKEFQHRQWVSFFEGSK
jgi:hypothetical protein